MILASAATVLLAQLPVAWPIRVVAVLLSWSLSGLELWQCWRQYRAVSGFRLLADGSVDIEAPDGSRSTGVMAAGSVALRELAWFRWRSANGRVRGELISRIAQERDDWRRFRVICRHVAAC